MMSCPGFHARASSATRKAHCWESCWGAEQAVGQRSVVRGVAAARHSALRKRTVQGEVAANLQVGGAMVGGNGGAWGESGEERIRKGDVRHESWNVVQQGGCRGAVPVWRNAAAAWRQVPEATTRSPRTAQTPAAASQTRCTSASPTTRSAAVGRAEGEVCA